MTERDVEKEIEVAFAKALIVADFLKQRFPNLTVTETMGLAQQIVKLIGR